ncbi:hypothetical protein EJ05DRAFT_520679 [Pseudovirgaria hyperparasitica]|uniref:3-hydroxyacyl-CoA dehydrogenase n=1 Tax=Pseudovirgaria hyperparasitica TaxID=470096 RepID=A0A6A6W0F6_9PEZI|nr:uncharacterized protein EJ05DRAFT_520679 [Pseudovirgaria hyperparasitica]KAF2754551.1 hypothetical protein EJ05DRAFT_520679 [Pseudovirgaria hyperparasitica]
MADHIRTVGVVGTGVIGSSWIALFLARGLHVVVSDPAPGAREKLDQSIQATWPTMRKIGLSDNASPTNYRFVDDVVDHLDEVQFVQENAPEKKEFKAQLFGRLDAKAAPNTVIASSSSGIPSSQFIDQCHRAPERVLIGHPFNPPHLMPLVEVVPHTGTTKDASNTALEFYRSLGKSPILIHQETPGFVANRLQAAVIREAKSLVFRGVVSARDVDAAMTNSLGPRWAINGPFMSQVLGGGGGKDGFLKLQRHLGPMIKEWLDDMDEHRTALTEEGIQMVDHSVQDMVVDVDLGMIARHRDDAILDLLTTKRRVEES